MDQFTILSGDKLKEWERERSKTMKLFTYGGFINGLLINGYYSTMYQYVQRMVNDKNTEQYYSLLLGLPMIAGAVSSFIGSIYYDFTKNVKQAIICSLVLMITGNIIYALPYSIYLVTLGYAMILCQSIALATMYAEINHIFLPEQLTATTGRIAISRALGTLAGPCLALGFSKVNVEIGSWTLSAGNMPAVVFGGMCLISLFFAMKITNLAKIYDLKAVHVAKRERSIGNA